MYLLQLVFSFWKTLMLCSSQTNLSLKLAKKQTRVVGIHHFWPLSRKRVFWIKFFAALMIPAQGVSNYIKGLFVLINYD